MRMTEIKEKAKELGVKTNKINKVDLIRAIQLQEGNLPCFATNREACDQSECCWKDDCVSC
jgi:hypothetical protein